MREPEQSVHECQLPGMIEFESRNPFAVGKNGRLGQFQKLSTIDAGPGYSTAHGPVVEGERMQMGLIRMP